MGAGNYELLLGERVVVFLFFSCCNYHKDGDGRGRGAWVKFQSLVSLCLQKRDSRRIPEGEERNTGCGLMPSTVRDA